MIQFPHCDARILHGPKSGCKYCLAAKDLQKIRRLWNINFTGEYETERDGVQMLPDPAELARPINKINRWYGNAPQTEEDIKQLDEEHKEFSKKLAEELNK